VTPWPARARLRTHTLKKDRQYAREIYDREPAASASSRRPRGGFDRDEPVSALGSALMPLPRHEDDAESSRSGCRPSSAD
jgi:hypothetical protein